MSNKEGYWRLRAHGDELLIFDNVGILKHNGKIYYTDNKELISYGKRTGHFEKEKIGNVIWILYLSLLFIAIVMMCVFLSKVGAAQKVSITWGCIPCLLVYSLIQMFLHELAHCVALRSFGRCPSRIGVKMNYYIFPAFYVRMNDVNLLQKRQKIVVHTAGVFVNIVVNCLVIAWAVHIRWWNMIIASCWFGVSVLWNALPFLDSDGYKTLLVVCSKYQTQNKRRGGLLVRSLNLINFIIVFLYIVLYFILFWRICNGS